ncbi:ATP-binding cassette domain-containing protein [Pseudosulfitobacter sp. DSM 107133]|uniref:ATP-binding cassette domain-containing protein n=1 Tax=Pseudosulfitobacter sp. DSM 107133 TaxID=2883100 RepID=UPI000DF20CCD|nr:ATP-binding cassette domain-containing protein [Pseudosulfitobacter sp. DSM 107133]UOA29737.1 Oligopeptide transport ATP-binding protein OppF [Pseudosulfitobacter sp. DSM 107133]
MSPSVLEIKCVEKYFQIASGILNGRQYLNAVNKVSLSIETGEILGLVGESGCGKSTLSRMMLGLMTPSAGEILLGGTPIQSMSRFEVARQVQPVFQDPSSSLNPSKRVGAIIGLPLVVHGVEKSAKSRRIQVESIMERVGLPRRYYDTFPHQLSGGQRQRVSIARALILSPELLICDEPTSALDVSVQSQILNLLQDLQKDSNLTMIIISHNLAVIEHLATRVAVMYRGEIVEENCTEALFSEPCHPYTQKLLSSVLTPESGLQRNLETRKNGIVLE